MKVMTDVERERLWPVVANSPARLILHGLHFDSQMTPPHLFTQVHHALLRGVHASCCTPRASGWPGTPTTTRRRSCASSKEAGFDMAECFCTAPMVNVTLAEARKAWGHDCIIFGGVPSVVLEETFPDDEFEEYMRGRLPRPGHGRRGDPGRGRQRHAALQDRARRAHLRNGRAARRPAAAALVAAQTDRQNEPSPWC